MTALVTTFLAEISTARLELLCLPPEHLRLLLVDPTALEKAIGFAISRDCLTPIVQRALQKKLTRMATASPQDYPWFTYWLIGLRETRFGAGLIGFKGIPSGPADVEIGYGIDAACQGRGYITEAVRGLTAWAFTDPRCTGIYAAVLKTNPASSRVLEKAGFSAVSTTSDTIFWRLAPQ